MNEENLENLEEYKKRKFDHVKVKKEYYL